MRQQQLEALALQEPKYRRQRASRTACKRQIERESMEACNIRSVSVHIPSVIFTPQRGRRHNTLPFEGSPTALVSN